MNIFEWQTRNHEIKNVSALNNYLAEVWENRNLFTDGDTFKETMRAEEEQELNKRQRHVFLDVYETQLRTRNYVGFIQFEEQEINIFPKIFKPKEGIEPNWNLYLNHLLYWLSYCNKIKFPFLEVSLENQSYDNLLEVFVYVFANYAEKIITELPYHCYEELEEETPYMRGSLSFNQYFRLYIATGKWQAFFCNYEPFIFDNKVNQIIKHTTKLLFAISKNEINVKKLRNILFLLDEVSEEHWTYEDCDRVNINRFFEEYDIIISMCRMFLASQAISKSSSSRPHFCLLFPMEYIFEDFIAGFIQTHFSDLNPLAQSTTYLAKDGDDKKAFQISNDIYIPERLIIDTKYKIRNVEPGDKKQGVLPSDMYQMISYAIARECSNVALIYPCTKYITDAPKTQFTISDNSAYKIKNILISVYDVQITTEEEENLSLKLDNLIKDQLNELLK